jgi:hypothetical protein
MSKSKSNHSSQSNQNPSPLALPPIGGAHALPEVGAPTPPADGVPVVRDKGRRLIKAHRAQLDVALEAADELRKSTHFADVFGARYAVAHDVANAVEFATRWSREAQAAKAWASYTTQQAELAWDFTNVLLEKLRAPFLAASGGDSAFAKELHAFARLLTARSDSAKRGAAKRAANAKEKAHAQAQAHAPPGAAPPTAQEVKSN